jgi:choline dehydrogenase-like flavoprotein
MDLDAPTLALKSPEELTAELLEKGHARDAEKSHFDYIIVGSGAGGGPLASRLALAGKKVLVIEAGRDPVALKSVAYPAAEAGEVTRIPGYYAAASEDAEMSWMFSVRHHADDATQEEDAKYDKNKDPNTGGDIPKKYLDAPEKGRKQGIFYPRSSGIGGCTGHHAMITIRPNDRDWDYIADLTGDDSWRAGSMEGYFAKLERNQYIDAYDHFLTNLLGVLYKIWRRIVLFVDPRAVLDEGGHGFKGWAPTNLIDPFLVSMIAKDDQPFFKVIVRAALGALHGRWSPITWLKGQLLRSRVVPAIDFNDVNTRRTHSQGVFLIPLGIEGGTEAQADGEPAKGRRFGVREFLTSTRFEHPDKLVIKSGAHVTRVLFAPGEKGGPPRAIGVECAIGDHLYEASPKQNPSKERVTYFVKKEVGEVILCGGAFNTPQLLMLSGIGEKAHLAKKGINGLYGAKKNDAGDYHAKLLADAKVIDLPGVGCNLQDRYEVTVVSELDHELTTLHGVSFEPGDKDDPARGRWLQDRTGLYTTNGGTLAVIRVSKPAAESGEEVPDLFTFGAPAAFRGYYWNWSRELFRETLDADEDMRRIWSWVILKAYTRNHHGTVRLRTDSPFDMPEICFDSFNEKAEERFRELAREWLTLTRECQRLKAIGEPCPEALQKRRAELDVERKEVDKIVADSRRDLAALVDAVEFMRAVNARNPEQFVREIQPAEFMTKKNEELRNAGKSEWTLADWIKTQAWGHHASCTCRIGSDPWRANPDQLNDRCAVLDSQFRVHGVVGLRIVDASVFPKIPGYFIFAPIVMVSEKAADTLLAESTGSPYPAAFEASEATAIRIRREKAHPAKGGNSPDCTTVGAAPEEPPKAVSESTPEDRKEDFCKLPSRTVGLALSGGGIRSATFALGVLQSLAAFDRLRDVDFLSTVSGGGFIGSFLGRLFTRDLAKTTHDPCGRVQDIVKDSSSAPLWWLRTQANYIFATGEHDLRQNLAIFWRNIFAIHLVIGALCFTLFGLLAWLPDAAGRAMDYYGLFQVHAMLGSVLAPPVIRGLELSRWWWLPVVVLGVGLLPTTLGYWLAPKVGSYRPYPFFSLLAWLVLLTGAVCLLQIPNGFLYASGGGLILLLAWAWQEMARWGTVHGSGIAAAEQEGLMVRNRLVRLLAIIGLIFVALVGWVALDTFAALFGKWKVAAALTAVMVALGPLLPLLRYLAIKAQQQLSKGGSEGFSLVRAAQLLGLPLAIALLFVVDVLAHRLFYTYPGCSWGLLIIGITCAFSLAIGRAFDFLNLSSLHAAFAVRLTRTFQGASNEERVYAPSNDEGKDIKLAHPGDDIPFDQYHPEQQGGPIHFINVCINETVDLASGRNIRERKGLPMCVTPHGVSVGRRYFANWTQPDKPPRWQRLHRWIAGTNADDDKPLANRRLTALQALPVSVDPNAFHVLKTKDSQTAEVESLSLGNWIAISGAAFTTGIGRGTKLGLSLFTGLANVRLGYWWDSGVREQDRPGRYPLSFVRKLQRVPITLFRMQSLLLSEWRARFHGASRWFWYLSDGGHFDVTGVYELLRRRVPLIVLTDAGEDPQYRWGDVALLMQEAREDFGAEIKWIDFKKARKAEKKRRAALTDQERQQEDSAEAAKEEKERIAKRWQRIIQALPGNLKAPDEWIQNWIQLDSLGALEDISDRDSPYHAAIARVKYDGTEEISWLLLLKPSLSKELSEDILNYGKDHRDFPQQSTFDQVFDDIQWECYRSLGEQIGCKVLQPA